MIRTVLAAGLLAALAMPALAEDATVKTDKSADVKIDRTTTSSTTDASRSKMIAPTATDGDMYGGCMHHHDSALNMM
jgi:hypothetical protein